MNDGDDQLPDPGAGGPLPDDLGGVRHLLGDAGPIACRLPHFEPRPQQIDMAVAVERALAERRHLLVEAGTGVGKSFAYLLPAVLHAVANQAAGPVVISTRTIALQEQLEHQDLPFLSATLPLEWSSVTAIGRNHHLCRRRMQHALQERGGLFEDPEFERQLARVVEWSATTPDGIRQDLPEPVTDEVWEEVRAEHGNCLARACKHYEVCGWQKARRRMERCQILVVNHALYMADLALRMAGTRYLPPHEVVIFDEAHHLEDVATESLGLRLTRGTLRWHLSRLHSRGRRRSLLANHGTPEAMRLWQAVRKAGEAFFAGLDGRLRGRDEAIALGQEELDDPLSELVDDLADAVDDASRLSNGVDRRMELQARARGLAGLAAIVRQLCQPGGADHVRWLERERRQHAALHAAPLSVADALREHLFDDRGPTCVLTSATLGTAGEGRQPFAFLRGQLGLDEADELRLGSPFDYRERVRFVLEEALPDPSRDPRGYEREACARIESHVVANGGRALVLCTSWAFCKAVRAALAEPLAEAGLTLLVQGDAPLKRLLAAKRAEPTSVLLGVDSLWEGIDLPGEALTMVVVTRFPFANPHHPLLQARLAAIEARGGHAFVEHSLPAAVLRFRQGFGRLIRRGSDHGTVVLLDPRVRTKPYGRRFLDALPDGVDPDPGGAVGEAGACDPWT